MSALSPLRAARLESIKAHLKGRARSAHLYNRGAQTVALTVGTYADLRRLGFSRSDVDRAAEEMVRAGQAQFLTSAYSGVHLKFPSGTT